MVTDLARIHAVPADEHEAFFALPESERKLVLLRLEAMREIATSRNRKATYADLSRRYAHEEGGWSPRTLLRLWLEYKKSGGNWQVLRRDWKPGGGKLPEDFVTFWNSLVAQNVRKNDAIKAAWEALVHEHWLRNRPVPGYGKLTEWWLQNHPDRPMPRGVAVRPGDLPEGWSYSNLSRRVVKAKATRALASRQSYHEAHGHMMQLLRDRSKLRPLELITFDDVRFDLQVLSRVDGGLQVAYLTAVVALDVATGRVLAYGIKPRLKREDGTHMGVTRAETRFLLCKLLEDYGLAPWTMHLLLENASATLSPKDMEAFTGALGGKLEIETTGLVRKRLLTGGFIEQGGCPWQKGWIEAFFRALQTRLAALPGATGNRYDNDPGDLQGRLAWTRKLIRQVGNNLDLADQLRWPVLREEEAHTLIGEMIERLNWRTDHRLQGFARVTEWHRGDGRWMPYEALCELSPSERMEAVFHERMEAPQERWNRLLDGVSLSPVHPAVLLPLYGEKRAVTVRDAQVSMRVKAISDDELYYRDDARVPLHNYEGESFLGCLSHDGGALHLFEPETHRYVASVPQLNRVDCTDRDALERAAGEVERSRIHDVDTARRYQSERELGMLHDRAHNDAILEAMQEAENRPKKPRGDARVALNYMRKDEADAPETLETFEVDKYL